MIYIDITAEQKNIDLMKNVFTYEEYEKAAAHMNEIEALCALALAKGYDLAEVMISCLLEDPIDYILYAIEE